MHLDREVCAAYCRLGGVQLGHRRLGGVRLARVLQPAGPPHQCAGGVAVEDHVGDHLLHELERRERAIELLTLLRVGDRRVDASLADAHAARRDAEAARVERRHRNLEPVADLAEQSVVTDLHAVERELRGVGRAQAELAVDRLRGEPVGLRVDEERGQPAVLLLRISLGEDQRELRVVAHRDEHLLAADPPAAVDLLRAGGEVGRVGSGARLG